MEFSRVVSHTHGLLFEKLLFVGLEVGRITH